MSLALRVKFPAPRRPTHPLVRRGLTAVQRLARTRAYPHRSDELMPPDRNRPCRPELSATRAAIRRADSALAHGITTGNSPRQAPLFTCFVKKFPLHNPCYTAAVPATPPSTISRLTLGITSKSCVFLATHEKICNPGVNRFRSYQLHSYPDAYLSPHGTRTIPGHRWYTTSTRHTRE